MTQKLKVEDLRKLIAKEAKKVLLEVKKEEKEKGKDSLDAEIDKYFVDYESEAISSKKEGKDFKMMVRSFLLKESKWIKSLEYLSSDNSKKESDNLDNEKDINEVDDEQENEPDNKKLTLDDIDVESFSNHVVRLVENYDSLLDVKNIIVRRAINFLIKNYNSEVIENFKNELSEIYDINVGKTKAEIEDEKYEAPAADRAGPGLGS